MTGAVGRTAGLTWKVLKTIVLSVTAGSLFGWGLHLLHGWPLAWGYGLGIVLYLAIKLTFVWRGHRRRYHQ